VNVPIELELAREIARQGEARLAAIMSLATAADLRATTLCGIFGTSSVALTGLILGGAVGAAGLFMAAFIAANAGAPRDLFIAGGNPDFLREWSWDAGKWRTEVEMLDATANRYAASIAANRDLLELGSKRVIAALWVAGASLPIGISAFVIQALI
jgi:hypothetical protein